MRNNVIQNYWQLFMQYDEKANQYKKVQYNWQWVFLCLMILPSFLAAIAFFLPILDKAGDHMVPILKMNKLDKFWYIIAFVVGVLSAIIIALEKFLKSDNDLTEKQKLWIKSRSIAEAIKSHLYLFAAHSGIYGVDDPAAITLLNSEIEKIEQDASDILLAGVDISNSGFIGKAPIDNIDIENYIKDRAQDQADWYKRKLMVLDKNMRNSKKIVRWVGVVTSILGVLAVYFSSTFILPFFAAIATAVKTYSINNKYTDTLNKYNAAQRQLSRIIMRKGYIADGELISQCEQVMRAENGSWQNMW